MWPARWMELVEGRAHHVPGSSPTRAPQTGWPTLASPRGRGGTSLVTHRAGRQGERDTGRNGLASSRAVSSPGRPQPGQGCPVGSEGLVRAGTVLKQPCSLSAAMLSKTEKGWPSTHRHHSNPAETQGLSSSEMLPGKAAAASAAPGPGEHRLFTAQGCPMLGGQRLCSVTPQPQSQSRSGRRPVLK